MKKHLAIILLFFSGWHIVTGQQDFYTIKGIVKDSSDNAAVVSASIVNTENSQTAVSDKNGFFRIVVTSFPCKLKITHLGYCSREYIVNSVSSGIEVLLDEKISELHELSVTTDKPVAITRDEPLYIKDYELVDDKILALAYKNSMLSRARLYVMSLEGDTNFSVAVKKPEQLYKDCFDNNYFLTGDNAFQLNLDSDNIDFLYPCPAEEFSVIIDLLEETRNNKLYLKKYSLNDQVLDYIEYDLNSKKYADVITVENEANTRMLVDRNRIVNSADDPEVQARFEDLAFYKPVFAPLKKIRDTLCIFNFEDSWIGFLDDSCKLIKKIPIAFHKDKNWKREIYFDDASGKIYAMFRKDGISTLKEINIENGQLINSVQIPDLPYVDNIKINNGKLYFLYTDHSQNKDLRMLYSMKM